MLRWLSADNLKLLPADETGQLSGVPLKDRKGGLPQFNEVQTAQCLLWDRSENAKCYCITLADHRPAISPDPTLSALATSACNSLAPVARWLTLARGQCKPHPQPKLLQADVASADNVESGEIAGLWSASVMQ